MAMANALVSTPDVVLATGSLRVIDVLIGTRRDRR
jgi:hypothetical protein